MSGTCGRVLQISSDGLNSATIMVIPLGKPGNWAVVDKAQGGIDDVRRSGRCRARCDSFAEHGDW
eukprot:6517170-Heterocapsa_arctica.AAC.1